MIKAILELYILVLDRESYSYLIVSEHSEKFAAPSVNINAKVEIESLLSLLYIKHTNTTSSYTNFISLNSYIRDEKLIVPYYCIVPYNIETKESYLLRTENHRHDLPIISKILNSV